MIPTFLTAFKFTLALAASVSGTSHPPRSTSSYNAATSVLPNIRAAMLGSIRTSWEQGTASSGILEADTPTYSLFGSSPFSYSSSTGLPVTPLQFGLSAVTRQTSDGRLSQNIGDGLDGAALDGASAGSVVLLGSFTEPSKKSYWLTAATKQLDYLLYTAPRTSTGAISHRADSKQYWADGVFMGPPFIAYYGAVTSNQTLLQLAYDNCRLYRSALRVKGPYGYAWGHIYDDDTKTWSDKGIWGTGNAWAALGMLRVALTIQKSSLASKMTTQSDNLIKWVKEILDGTLPAAVKASPRLIPDYIQGTSAGNATFGDASSSAALASVTYRVLTLYPTIFSTANYSTAADQMSAAVINGVTELGLMAPVVDPLSWSAVGVVSTEAQAFGLMMIAAWKDYLGE